METNKQIVLAQKEQGHKLNQSYMEIPPGEENCVECIIL